MKFCRVVRVRDVITYTNFRDDRFRDFWGAGVEFPSFPLTFTVVLKTVKVASVIHKALKQISYVNCGVISSMNWHVLRATIFSRESSWYDLSSISNVVKRLTLCCGRCRCLLIADDCWQGRRYWMCTDNACCWYCEQHETSLHVNGDIDGFKSQTADNTQHHIVNVSALLSNITSCDLCCFRCINCRHLHLLFCYRFW